MPAGGTWIVQNKPRPGAYINFVAVPKPVGALGNRGVVACAVPMTWGPDDKLIKLTGEELINGKSIPKIGCDAFNTEESLPYRIALSGCSTALLFRMNTGGVKATVAISSNTLTANAKYAGSTGNSISVVITKDIPATGKFTVDVLFNQIKKESFVVTVLSDFNNIESEWVDFVVASGATNTTVPVTAGSPLAGGTNGTVSTASLSTFFNLISGESWQCVAVNSTDSAVQSTLVDFVKSMREKKGRKVQGVVYDYADADHEGIISVNQGYKTDTDTVGTDLFPLFVASMTAGSNVNESNTAAVVPGAVSIINPIDEEDIEAALNAGKFLLTYRQDGAVCVEKDINTLHTFTPDKGYAFSKNRVIRCLDEIGNTTALVFNRNYCGKVDNNDVGRNTYKTELISMMDSLVGIGAIQNFEGASDIIILPGSDIDSVVVDMVVQPVDSMEKLYMTVNVDA